jgi:hypothetical protein
MYIDFTFSSMLFACPFLPSLPQSHNTPNRKKKKKTLFGAKERKGNCLQKSSSERLKKYHKDMLTMKS